MAEEEPQAVAEAAGVEAAEAELRRLPLVPVLVQAAEELPVLPGPRGFHLLLRGRQNRYPGPKRRPGKGLRPGRRTE